MLICRYCNTTLLVRTLPDQGQLQLSMFARTRIDPILRFSQNSSTGAIRCWAVARHNPSSLITYHSVESQFLVLEYLLKYCQDDRTR